MEENKILIKKYANRRLYCVNIAKYVSLNDIKTMIEDGKDIKVIEKNTDKNITKYILMQILLENNYEVFPEFLLKMLIQNPNVEVMNQFFKEFFIPMLDYFIKMNVMGNNNPFFTNPFMQNPFMGNIPFNNSNLSGNQMTEMMSSILKRLSELEKKSK